MKQIDGIWCVSLIDGEGKRHKNLPSRRTIPLHSQLLPRLLPWLEQRPTGKLFPLCFAEKEKANTISRWFTNALQQTGVKRKQVSLHSLRHSVTVKLIEAETHLPIQNRILGHAIGKDVELGRYGRMSKFTPQRLSEAIEKISFPDLPALLNEEARP